MSTTSAPGYLTISDLCIRYGYAEQTVRNLMHARVLRRGEHYLQRGPKCKILFSATAFERWLLNRPRKHAS